MQHLSLSSLLAVHAHPDDETLSNGGLLAKTVAAGFPAAVVTLTRGEQGEVIGALQGELEGNGPLLARHREGELKRALGALGVKHHTFLDQVPGDFEGGIVDSGMAWAAAPDRDAETQLAGGSGQDQDATSGLSATAQLADSVPHGALVSLDLDDLALRLARIIIEVRPHTVVTYEPGGGYGHPDHVRTHEVTVRAIALAQEGIDGDSHRVSRLLWTVIPREVLTVAREALSKQGRAAAPSSEAIFPQPDDPMASVAQWVNLPVLACDITPVLDRVLGALTAHATQVKWVRAFEPAIELGPVNDSVCLTGTYALSNSIMNPLLSHEFYVLHSACEPDPS